MPTSYTPASVTHRDFKFEHIFYLDESRPKFGIIDFGLAAAHDPFIDFYELGLSERTLNMILDQYKGPSEQIAKKVSFQTALDDIRREYKRLS